MTWLRRLVGRRQLARDLADEIDAHLAERTDELEAEGLPREEAHRRARCEFGNVTAIEERGREVWRWATLENLWSDLRYGARQLRGAPAFTLATVLTLALGIGVNSAVFSVIDAVLLRPLPFPQPDRRSRSPRRTCEAARIRSASAIRPSSISAATIASSRAWPRFARTS